MDCCKNFLLFNTTVIIETSGKFFLFFFKIPFFLNQPEENLYSYIY